MQSVLFPGNLEAYVMGVLESQRRSRQYNRGGSLEPQGALGGGSAQLRIRTAAMGHPVSRGSRPSPRARGRFLGRGSSPPRCIIAGLLNKVIHSFIPRCQAHLSPQSYLLDVRPMQQQAPPALQFCPLQTGKKSHRQSMFP